MANNKRQYKILFIDPNTKWRRIGIVDKETFIITNSKVGKLTVITTEGVIRIKKSSIIDYWND